MKRAKVESANAKASDEEIGDEESSDENVSENSERNEEQMIADLEELTKSKDVENSTLRMGYNEEDYEYSR